MIIKLKSLVNWSVCLRKRADVSEGYDGSVFSSRQIYFLTN